MGRYWVFLFFLSFLMSLCSSEKVFIKTVNCKPRRQERFSHMCLKVEGDTVLVPGINTDLGFKYRVQLSLFLFLYTICVVLWLWFLLWLIRVLFAWEKGGVSRGAVWVHPLCISSLFYTWEQSQFFNFFFLLTIWCHHPSPLYVCSSTWGKKEL